ncbi:MsnO8 family LLM class oxidoreductase [Paenibacillus sp. YPG26]|uniref:MsnO8 family LLM class oxidoreductase n=1 Tax=Paenibacillus sp. YPG26 TaxID=2878915 RepID=UPI00203B47D4|nr:MsnO8 family LLM class oxidoreductase [Paenibacillus sp. YPG26]USB31898.1 MsnO8 family LLM class oxidoreductase [Paenibacillus sp. YPG26]
MRGKSQMQSIKLSVLDLVPQYNDVPPETALQEAIRLAIHSEAWGYDRYWAAEHHDLEGLACASPEILLSHIGARTQRIRLGTGALLLPHYSPMKVAESFHLLSCLNPGRIDLGIGRAPGGPAHASMALSGNFLQHVADMPTSMDALIKFFEDGYQYEGHPVKARPIPKEPPQVWMLGTNEKGGKYAAEFGTGYVFGHFMSEQDGARVLRAYREEFRPGKLRHFPETLVAVSVICAESEEKARSLTPPASSPIVNSLVGHPDKIQCELRKLQRTLGNSEFLVHCPIPDYEARLESYRLLAGQRC